MLVLLNEDLQYFIYESLLDFHHLRLLNTTGILPENYNKRVTNKLVKLANQIKLTYMLTKSRKVLFRDIDRTLNRHFTYNFTGQMSYNNTCLLYSPFTQYGICRFCCKQRIYHKYDKMMNIYLQQKVVNLYFI